jgi:membrane-associated phospholipid phosphatase
MPRYLLLKVAAAALCAFAVTAILASSHPYFPGDLWVSHRLQELDAAPFQEAMAVASAAVEWPWAVILMVGVLGVLAGRRRWPEALLFLAAQALRPLNVLLKEVVGRPRPSPLLVQVREFPDSPSFPSGHMVSAMVLFGLLFMWAPALGLPRPLRWLVRACCLYAVAFTAMERIYSGAHWLSDVYGAFLLAIPWLSFLLALRTRVRGGAS